MFAEGKIVILGALFALSPAVRAEVDQTWFDRQSRPGHSMRVLSNGADLLAARLEIIGGANRTLFITAFSFFDDPGGRVYQRAICARKRERPRLDVRILIDHIGSWGSKRLAEDFRACGVPVVYFNALLWDLKDFPHALHEKMLIVDGRRMIIGGSGYGDLYADAGRDRPTWYDLDLDLSGPSVCEFYDRFAGSWRKSRKLALRQHFQEDTGYDISPEYARYLYGREGAPPCAEVTVGGSRAVALHNSPYFDPKENRPLLDAYLGAMAKAGGPIKLYSPYFIPHGRFARGLLAARAEGLEVKILTNSPRSTDAGPMAVIGPFLETRDLLAAGVEIYLWSGSNTMHRKGGVYGNRWAYFGSDNLDRRGQDYSSEAIVFTDDPGAIAALGAEMDRDFADSYKVTPEYVDQYLAGQPGILKLLTTLVMPYL